MIVWTFTCKHRGSDTAVDCSRELGMDAVLFSATDLLYDSRLFFKHYSYLYPHVYASSLYCVLTVCRI